MARGRKRTNTYYEMALFGSTESKLFSNKKKKRKIGPDHRGAI